MEKDYQEKRPAYRLIVSTPNFHGLYANEENFEKFNERVCEALEDGYQLYGSPCFDSYEGFRCAQAVVLPEFLK